MMDHVDGIMSVMNAAFDPLYGEAWSQRQVSEALVLPNTFYLVANKDGNDPLDDDEICGFAMSRGAVDEEELLLLAVHPSHQGKGIGRRLLARFLTAARNRGVERIFLEMRDGNSALELYKSSGFVECGRRPNYYRSGTDGPFDAITFVKTLV